MTVQTCISEETMLPHVVGLFLKPNNRFACEVPLGPRTIDLVVLGRHITAVELKVRDWRRAFRQAYIAQLAVHFSYIAIWHEYCGNVNVEHLRLMGIGLIAVRPGSSIILSRPSRSKIRHQDYVRRLKKYLHLYPN